MAELELKRGKISAILEGNILLGPSDIAIKPFRLFCKELGAGATFSNPLNSKSEIDFSNESVIAYADKPTKKLISDLDKDDNVLAISTNLENIKDVMKNSTKPVLAYVNYKEIDNIPAKVSGVVVNFVDDEEIEADSKVIKTLKKTFDKVLVRAKFETPEEMYNLIKDTSADGIVIVDYATYKPTIFEQTENYFEKGYYNKLTRKRREKVVARFEQIYKQNETDSEKLAEYNQRFLEE